MEILLLLLIVVVLAVVAFSVLGLAVQVFWALLIGGLVGLIADAVVSLFQPAGGPRGCLQTALAGIGGSLLATIFFNRQGFIAAVIGAIVVVAVWKLLTTRRYAY